MQHSLEQYADQIVVIAASPGNTIEQIDKLCTGQQTDLKEKLFKEKGVDGLVDELVKRQIAVNCLYLGADDSTYFFDLSKKTQGLYVRSKQSV